MDMRPPTSTTAPSSPHAKSLKTPESRALTGHARVVVLTLQIMEWHQHHTRASSEREIPWRGTIRPIEFRISHAEAKTPMKKVSKPLEFDLFGCGAPPPELSFVLWCNPPWPPPPATRHLSHILRPLCGRQTILYHGVGSDRLLHATSLHAMDKMCLSGGSRVHRIAQKTGDRGFDEETSRQRPSAPKP